MGDLLPKRENTYPHVVNGPATNEKRDKNGGKKKGTWPSLPSAVWLSRETFLNLLSKYKEEKSFRHVAMEAKKYRSRGNMAEKTKEVDMYDFPVHDCIQ